MIPKISSKLAKSTEKMHVLPRFVFSKKNPVKFRRKQCENGRN